MNKTDAFSILEEFKRRQEHAVNTYEPSNRGGHNQTEYHNSSSRVRLLFGGNQSGKSHAAAFDCACNARGRNTYNTQSNIIGRNVEIWVIAPEYSLIKNGIYRHLKNIIPDWDLINEGARVPGHNLPTYITIRRADGYMTLIQFLSAKGENREKFQAAAVDYFYIDEEIPGEIWEELEARTLATGGKFSISATLVESYDWILELEGIAEREKNYDRPSISITRLNTELNPYLDRNTVQHLKQKWSKETLEYRFYGRARRLTGLIYNTFDSEKHIVNPFTIPHDWPRWCAIDPGIRVCAVLWIAVGPDNKSYAYRELYESNRPLWDIAKVIRELEGWILNKDLTVALKHYVWDEIDSTSVRRSGVDSDSFRESEHMVIRLIDPKSKARSEAGEESIVSQLYSRFGLLCCTADNSVRPGIEDCRYWLENGFYVFDTLVNFLEERRTYRSRPLNTRRRDQNEPIEDPIRRKNHLMDCWRYIAREHPKFNDRFRDEMFNDISEGTPLGMTTAERIKRNLESKEYAHDILGSEW